MADRPPRTPEAGDPTARPKAVPATRDARLKAALQANIARRKARDKALSADEPDPSGGPGPDDIPEKD